MNCSNTRSSLSASSLNQPFSAPNSAKSSFWRKSSDCQLLRGKCFWGDCLSSASRKNWRCRASSAVSNSKLRLSTANRMKSSGMWSRRRIGTSLRFAGNSPSSPTNHSSIASKSMLTDTGSPTSRTLTVGHSIPTAAHSPSVQNTITFDYFFFLTSSSYSYSYSPTYRYTICVDLRLSSLHFTLQLRLQLHSIT